MPTRGLSQWLSGLGHSACWPEGLRALTGLSSTPGIEEFFGSTRLAGMLRLNSRTGIEGT